MRHALPPVFQEKMHRRFRQPLGLNGKRTRFQTISLLLRHASRFRRLGEWADKVHPKLDDIEAVHLGGQSSVLEN